jgi:hypothetical protein
MKRFYAPRSIILCFVVLISSACSGGAGGAVSPSGEKPAVAGSMLFSDQRQGLDGLASYHMQAINEFTGEMDGKPQNSRLELTGDVTRASQTEFVEIIQPASGGKNHVLLSGVVADASYSRIGDEKEPCKVVWDAETKAPPSLWPVDLLPAIQSAAKVGTETINTIQAVHYTLDNNSLGNPAAEKVTGDFWLAESGGYVVKFDLTMSGAEKNFGKGRSGTQKLTYELTRINANDDFVLPAGCQPVLMDIPVMPDATNLNRMPETIRYITVSDADSVMAFYKEKLTASGWKSGSAHPYGDNGQIVLFFKSGEPGSLQVAFTKGKNGFSVTVSKLKPSEKPQVTGNNEGGSPANTAGNPLDPAKAGLPEGVPIYPGATDFTGIEGMRLVFLTADAVVTVTDFYKTNLKKENWSIMPGSGSVPEAPLMFQKSGRYLFVKIGAGEGGGSKVEITTIKH